MSIGISKVSVNIIMRNGGIVIIHMPQTITAGLDACDEISPSGNGREIIIQELTEIIGQRVRRYIAQFSDAPDP